MRASEVCPSGQFELVGHRGHQPLAQQLAFAHAPAHRHRRVHQADVDAAVLQGLGLLGIAHFAQHHLHARRLAPQFAQRARQRVEQRRGHQPHRQLAGAAARDLAGALLGGVDAGHADARVLDDGQRRRRGRGAQARTLEQAHAQVLSMRPNAWLSAGCAMPSHSAARLTPPWSITARK